MPLINKNSEFKFVALVTNIGLLLTHICLLISFYYLHIKQMYIFNIFSVLTYTISFWVIAKRKMHTYITIIITEILAHLIMATLCVGWDCGFYLYCFGTCYVIYYTSYIFREEKGLKHSTVIVAVISVTVFFVLFFYSHFNAPIYTISERARKTYFTTNSALIFTIIFAAMHNYSRIVSVSEQGLHIIADFDELTSVYTRRKAHAELQKFLGLASEGKLNFCITMMDVDNFKFINDTYGHDAGDMVLKTICGIISDQLINSTPLANVIHKGENLLGSDKLIGNVKKRNSFIARWGGDEFLIAQTFDGRNIKEEDCRNAIQRAHDAVSSSTISYGMTSIKVGTTGGFAVHKVGESIDETFKIADERLYKGKEKGKNCVVFQ